MSTRIPAEDVCWYNHDTAFPWGDWFDGSTWLLVPGQDFTQTVPAFRSLTYRMARDLGYRLRTRMTSAGLAIQALDPDRNPLPPLPPSAG